jgi:hypothetical protein
MASRRSVAVFADGNGHPFSTSLPNVSQIKYGLPTRRRHDVRFSQLVHNIRSLEAALGFHYQSCFSHGTCGR